MTRPVWSRRTLPAVDECRETVEAALWMLSSDDIEEAKRVSLQLIDAGGIEAVEAILEFCTAHPEDPHAALLTGIANAEGKRLRKDGVNEGALV